MVLNAEMDKMEQGIPLVLLCNSQTSGVFFLEKENLPKLTLDSWHFGSAMASCQFTVIPSVTVEWKTSFLLYIHTQLYL